MASYFQLPTVDVPGAYNGPGSVTLPMAEGWSASAGANPFIKPFPDLPKLPGIGDIFNPDYNWWTGERKPLGAALGDAVGAGAWWLTGRYVTVFLGLLFLAAGLYLFGTSQVADALSASARRAVA